jgi:polysaccharide biosynthesis/export protein
MLAPGDFPPLATGCVAGWAPLYTPWFGDSQLVNDMRSGLLGAGRASRWLMAGGLLFALCIAALPPRTEAAEGDDYVLQSGDVVNVSVWREPDLQQTILVRPDGRISFPLAGDLMAAGQTIAQLTEAIAAKLAQFIPSPVVTVSLKENLGNRVYVTGRVSRPGVYPVNQGIDVLQALALAGGLTPFADRGNIKVLRRENGVERAIPFNYKEVQRGDHLEQNIILRSGDTVLVP